MLIPCEFFVYTIKIIKSSAFGTYPKVSNRIFQHFTNNRKTEACTFCWRVFVQSIYLVCRIEIINTSEISAYPYITLIIIEDTSYRRVAETSWSIIWTIKSELTVSKIKFVQSYFGRYPKIAFIVFTATACVIGCNSLIFFLFINMFQCCIIETIKSISHSTNPCAFLRVLVNIEYFRIYLNIFNLFSG